MHIKTYNYSNSVTLQYDNYTNKCMKKWMEKVLQENMQSGLTRAQERVEILKMDVKNTITFHSNEQKELEPPTKYIEFEILV